MEKADTGITVAAQLCFDITESLVDFSLRKTRT